MSKKSDFGLIGLAVMGQNLVLNVESRGFQVSVFNRTTSVTDEFIAKHPGKALVGCHTLEDFVQSLALPRKIHIMVKSTAVKDTDRDAVDAVIEQLIPLLDKDDIIIDGGNSFYQTTERRDAYLAGKGLRFIGAGVSGGEEGARKGPSIMPGGPASTWEVMKPIFESIAAKVDGEPCVIQIRYQGLLRHSPVTRQLAPDFFIIMAPMSLAKDPGQPVAQMPFRPAEKTPVRPYTLDDEHHTPVFQDTVPFFQGNLRVREDPEKVPVDYHVKRFVIERKVFGIPRP